MDGIALGYSSIESGSNTYTIEELASGSIYMAIDENDNFIVSSDSIENAIADVTLAVGSDGLGTLIYEGRETATLDSTLNFVGGTSIGNVIANFYKSSGNFDVNFGNILSGYFWFSQESNIFAMFDGLNYGAQISITGGANDSNPDSGNTYYAVSGGTVASPADQAVITITDFSYEGHDVLKIDAGVANLTKDFFGTGNFYNYANAEDASTSGVYAGTVIDTSALVSIDGKGFAVMRMADGSASVDDNNHVDDSLTTTVIWANAGSGTTISPSLSYYFSSADDFLIFTNTNGTYGDVVSLSGDFNDTIHAGWNDTIDAGSGNDIIYTESNNVIYNFESGDSIYTGSREITSSISSNGDVILYLDNGSNTITIKDIPTYKVNIDGSTVTRVNFSGNDSIYIDGSNITIDTGDGSQIIDTIDSQATIDAESGDDVISVISGSGLYIIGGDGSDSISMILDTSYTSSLISDLTIDGGAGNDTIYNGYGHNTSINGGSGGDYISNLGAHVTISAGTGDDRVYNSGSYVSIRGGSGDDTIGNGTATGGGGTDVTIDGESGNDNIFNSWANEYSVVAGSGDDSIINRADFASVYGGDGNDTIANHGSSVFVEGGSGNDLIYNHVYFSSYTEGSNTYSYAGASIGGSNVDSNGAMLYGENSTIDTGAGIDTIYGDGSIEETFIHSADTDIIFGFGSGDTVSMESEEIVSSISSGSDVILITSNNGSIVLKNTSGSNVLINENIVTFGSNSIDTTPSNSIYASDENDTIYVDGSLVTIQTSSESLTYTIGSNATIDAGAGSDIINIESRENLSIIGGSGNDSIYNIAGEYVTIDGGDGIDTLIGQDSLSETFIHSADTDIIYGFGSGDTVSIESGAINSSVASGSDVLITTANGSIVLKNTSRSNVSIDGNILTFGSVTLPSDSVYASDDNDTVDIYENRVYIDNSSGTSVFTIDSNSTINVADGSDVVSVFDGNNLYIIGGNDSDTVFNSIASATTIDAGDGDDSINNQYGSYVSIHGGNGNDYIENLNGEFANIDGGSGKDSIENWASNVSIHGGDDDDYIENVGSYSSIDGGTGNDTIYSENMYSSIDGGSGNDSIYNEGDNTSIVGGDGNDTIYSYDANYVQIYGDSGNDYIINNAGSNVTISGGIGIDTLIGQDSISETFIHSADTDVIYGFGSGDTVSIESGAINSSISSGSDVILSTSNGSIILKNTNQSNLTIDDNLIIFNGSETVIPSISMNDDDSIFIDGFSATIQTFDGDSILSFGSNATIDAENGDDLISVISGTDLFVIGGSGNDSIFNSGNRMLIFGGSDNDYIQNINGTFVTMNGGIGQNILIGNDLSADLFIYGSGQDLIQNFGIGDSIRFDANEISSSVVSDDSVIFYFNQNENQTITIESVGSDNLSIDGGIIYYVGSTIGSSESDYTFTSRTIIRMVGDEMISVESNFRDDDVKFAYYGSDGEIHTSPTRTDATWEFVEMHHVNRVVSNRNVVSNQNVTISNGDATDTIDFASYSFDEISTQFTDSGLIISIDDSSLNIVGTNMTQFSLASGKYTADFSNHTFSS